uniref:TMEM132D_N domain-containing protein n=1 Tax=Steinernema glaseri TaxID=37863 RepID=A0A1I8A6C0_9BILA
MALDGPFSTVPLAFTVKSLQETDSHQYFPSDLSECSSAIFLKDSRVNQEFWKDERVTFPRPRGSEGGETSSSSLFGVSSLVLRELRGEGLSLENPGESLENGARGQTATWQSRITATVF